ncbi:conserved hypothetical protein [Vibrio chagasii]|nr:conserved hypothetical protein [Vibrio chagasii]CAH6930888.1 conserved hypothetical protein [Vibrio chagasii]
MMLSLTNPGLASANDGLLNVEAKHDNEMEYIVGPNRKATFPLSNHIELLDLSINRYKLEQATPHNQSGSSSSLAAKEGIIWIKFLQANNLVVSSRLIFLYFAANERYGYPLSLIKPKAAAKLEISINNVDASVTLHSRLLVKSEGQ